MKKIIPCTILLYCAVHGAEILAPIMVHTSSKELETQESAPDRVVVIDRQAIEASGAQNVEELMREVAGAVVSNHPFAKLSLQGFDGAYVKILVDGVEVSGDVGGSTPINLLSVSNIQQVEIMPGASSALYGSDAMGGVVNIITRKPKTGLRTEASQTIYSNERFAGSASAGWSNGKTGILLHGYYDNDNGKAADYITPFDEIVSIYPVPKDNSIGAGLTLRQKVGLHQLELRSRWLNAERTASGSSGMETNFDNSSWEAVLDWERPLGQSAKLEAWTSAKNYEYSSQQRNLNFNALQPKRLSVFNDYESEIKMSWEAHSWHSLLFGVNNLVATMEGSDFSEVRRTANIDVFAQNVIRFGGVERWILVPGLRMSNQLALGEEPRDITLTPKIAMRYTPDSAFTWRASYGMGYKRPSLKQKYWLFFHAAPANFMLIGNPDLNSERSHGFNTSAQWKISPAFNISIAGYANYIYDLITTEITDENSGTAPDLEGNMRNYIHVRTYVNRHRAYTTGGELSLNFHLPHTSGSLSYNHFKGRNKIDGDFVDMTGRSTHSARANATFSLPLGMKFHQQITWNGPQLYNSQENTYTPDYLMWDIRLEHTIARRLTLAVGVQNLLDNYNLQDGNYLTSGSSVQQESYFGLYDGRTISATIKANFP